MLLLSAYNKAVADVTDAEAASISTAIHDAGMSAWQHYINYGTAEKINPSNNFDTAKYLQAKAAALNAQAGTTEWTADKVAEAFKEAGMNALEHAILYSADDTPGEAAKAFNDNGSVIDAYSVTEKAAEGDDGGATFTLSARTDYADQTTAWTMNGDVQSDFHFTGGNETVNAVAGTLQASDILIDGSSDDADVLNATVIDSVASAGALVAPKLTNIETINLTVQGADAGLDMANVIGTKTVSVTGSQNGVLDNIAKASIPDVTVENYAKTLTLNFADLSGTTKNGTAETLNLTVKGGTAKTVVNLADNDNGDTLENLNITSSGDSANVLKITSSQGNAVSLETTKVSGTQDLNLSLKHGVVSGSALSTSDFSGKLGLTVDRDGALAATTNLTEVTGVTTYTFTDSTAGGDTLKASGIADGSTVVVAADFDGANTLAVSGAASSTANTLTLTLDADGDKAADVAIGTGLTIADVETITINSDNGKTAHTIDALTADAAKTINIVGDTALHLNMADTTSTLNTVTFGGAGKHEFTFDGETYADKVNLTLDGGSATGNLTLDASKFTGSGNNTLTINGGEGDDTITSALVGANVSAVINAGLGKDVITLSGTEEKYTIDLGKDDDTDTINLTTSGADQNMSITNFTLGSGGDKLVMDGLTQMLFLKIKFPIVTLKNSNPIIKMITQIQIIIVMEIHALKEGKNSFLQQKTKIKGIVTLN